MNRPANCNVRTRSNTAYPYSGRSYPSNPVLKQPMMPLEPCEPICETACESTCPSCEASPMNPSCSNMSQCQLLHWISITGFACDDILLYLDTHPTDMAALAYFKEKNFLYRQAVDEYARLYGPLNITHASDSTGYWEWINQPWPWQDGGNC